MKLVAIDPGAAQIGWARFEESVLVACGLRPFKSLYEVANFLVLSTRLTSHRPDLTRIVVEKPTVYPGSKNLGDPNDLIDLAAVVGACASISPHAQLVRAGNWKGQVPKEVHHRRVRRGLTLSEVEVLDTHLVDVAVSKRHNVLDAVGLGLWALGRSA